MFNIATVQKPAAPGLSQDGLSLLSPSELTTTLQLPAASWAQDWQALTSSWNRLPPDAHLKDGGHYRKRRHACFVQDTASGQLVQAPHRAHWQPTDYNALRGGFERWFDPLASEVANAAAWTQLLSIFGKLFTQVEAVPHWYIEAHA